MPKGYTKNGKPHTPPSFSGKRHSKETIAKMKESRKKYKGGRPKGYKHSKESIRKMSLARIGKKRKPFSIEWRRKMGQKTKGENNWNWKGGITPINQKIRGSIEYRLWRTSVFERDNYTCVWCGKWGGTLNADHIKPFAHYPELRFAIDNGRTLCIDCHKTTPNYLNRWSNN